MCNTKEKHPLFAPGLCLPRQMVRVRCDPPQGDTHDHNIPVSGPFARHQPCRARCGAGMDFGRRVFRLFPRCVRRRGGLCCRIPRRAVPAVQHPCVRVGRRCRGAGHRRHLSGGRPCDQAGPFRTVVCGNQPDGGRVFRSTIGKRSGVGAGVSQPFGRGPRAGQWPEDFAVGQPQVKREYRNQQSRREHHRIALAQAAELTCRFTKVFPSGATIHKRHH